MAEKEIINVDKTHRILVTRTQEDERIDPFIVFTPQRKVHCLYAATKRFTVLAQLSLHRLLPRFQI